MSLPKLAYPVFEIEIPSTKAKCKFRPFLVKEEKILLLAQQSGDLREIIIALQTVIGNCIQDESVKVEDLTTFDLEYLFIKLRSRSVNNVIEISYRDDEGETYQIEIDLEQVTLTDNPEHNKKVKVTDDLGIVLKYPNPNMIDKMEGVKTELELFFAMVRHCIEQIYDSSKVYKAKDYTAEDLEEFIQTLDVNTFKQIQKFFDTMPHLYYKAEYMTRSGEQKSIELTTLNDFFMLG